jgi:hypothetical protein
MTKILFAKAFANRQCREPPFIAAWCRNNPLLAREIRDYPSTFSGNSRIIVSIKDLGKSSKRDCKSFYPGSIPGEASNKIK